MARGKARFIGDGTRGTQNWQFSDSIREKIKSLCPEPSNESDDEYERTFLKFAMSSQDLADHFVEMIKDQADWAKCELGYLSKESLRKDICSELDSLLERATTLKDDFRRLSPAVDRLFTAGMEPLSYADYLDKVCNDLERVIFVAKRIPQKENKGSGRRKIAVEFAIRVLRSANEDYGMHISATAHPKDYWFSKVVDLLFYVGEDIGLNYKKTTWRDIIIKAQNEAPDLKPQE